MALDVWGTCEKYFFPLCPLETSAVYDGVLFSMKNVRLAISYYSASCCQNIPSITKIRMQFGWSVYFLWQAKDKEEEEPSEEETEEDIEVADETAGGADIIKR